MTGAARSMAATLPWAVVASRAEQKQAAREAREAAEREAAEQAARMRRFRLLGLAGLAALVVVVLAVALSSSGGSDKQKAAQRVAGSVQGAAEVNARFAGIPQGGTVLGKPDAPVTLTEFADLECPYCRQFSLSALPTLVRDEVRKGRLRIVYRIQTFVGQPGDSERAARFALAAARQGKFWQFADLFYVNQGSETTRYATDAFLTRLGRQVKGLDVAKALKERNSPAIQTEIDASSSAFDAAGFNATPSFLVGKTSGNRQVLQPRSLGPEDFTKAIDQLAK
jgi:protein-disulfide isomerase